MCSHYVIDSCPEPRNAMPHLALSGGTPLYSERLPPWSWPPEDSGDREAVQAYVAKHPRLSVKGDKGVIAECEAELANRTGLPYTLLCSSGTMALYSAYFALDLGPGDELICPAVTFHATASPALHLGAKVVLVDVEEDTGNIDLQALTAAITARTKAVVTNAMWGHPVEQEQVRQICDRYHLAWVEDISHAHFAIWNGRQVGTWGDIACMSLGAEKIITGGVGGALLTRKGDLYERAVLLGHYLFRSRQVADGGDITDPKYRPLSRTGYGLKLLCHPVAAAVILHQLRNRADMWIQERDRSLRKLREALSGLEGVRVPPIRPGVNSMGGWYGFKVWIDTMRTGLTRETIAAAIRAEGAEVDPAGSPGLHTLALFHDPTLPVGRFEKAPLRGTFPATERYHSGLLSLPTCTGSRDDAVLERLVRCFHKVWEYMDELR